MYTFGDVSKPWTYVGLLALIAAWLTNILDLSYDGNTLQTQIPDAHKPLTI